MASDFNPYAAPEAELSPDPMRYTEVVVGDAFKVGMLVGASITTFVVYIVTHLF